MNRILVGFHGKLPNVGDFVQRRLPASFVDRWDAAMQSALAKASAVVGESWREVFLASPPWRFALTTQVCGHLPWVGVVVPSFDRVGRVYPLVLAVSPPRSADGWPHMPANAWFDTLATAASRTRDGMDVTMFDALVAMLPDPARSPPQSLPPIVGLSTRSLWWQGDQPADGIALTGMPDAADYLRLLGVEIDEEPA
ncbi:type VI secretion system protein ImpM [Luteibacter sp. OK325]|uniref:type VI secretion system-associated protein TagF n=1 Tax=Luteibacter sp. OK325 TaxID=2135670 RepID=UPI000D3BE436|nr:type VI secretion system-associated protein TagF [Luteibacter sp. OK325]PTR34013.1 type VI secretion system protein ImpM [Luteibacter sp. OK325]